MQKGKKTLTSHNLCQNPQRLLNPSVLSPAFLIGSELLIASLSLQISILRYLGDHSLSQPLVHPQVLALSPIPFHHTTVPYLHSHTWKAA